ncbi:MAG: histidine phosphatase family protein [Oscillospiraceae bacterium]|nr:histidine phosphatase family protein [Oscillospiraceae bacterium]
MELYVSRHGETLSNAQRRLTGSINPPLSEKGIEQAKELGKSLEDISFDAVYSSPLTRAVETVKTAFGDKYKIITDKRLVEINLGDMEGMTYEDVIIKYPESGMLFFTDPVRYKTIPNGEHLEDMLIRISSFLDDITESGYDKVFVLTHGYAMRVMHACVNGGTVSAIGEAPQYSNCVLERYTYNGSNWEI